MTALHVDITGDCTSLLSALSNAEHAADHLAGRDYPFSITASGADAAIREVSRVSDAVAAGGGLVSVGADTRGLVAAQSEVSALRGGVQGLAQDLGSVGAASGSSFRTLAGDMGALGGSLSGAAGGMRDFSQASSGFATDAGRVSNAGSELEQQMRGYSAATQQATADTRELADVQNSVRSGGTPGGRFDRGGGGGNFGGDGGGSGGGGGGFKLPPRGVPGTPDGPPLPPGSGGGDGRGFGGDGGVGAPPLAMGAMVGGVGELLAGAAGIAGVAEAIKQVPDLAYAASGAMHQFDKSVRQAAQGAIAEGVPALHQLGQALRPLGSEVGAIGAQQMGTVLGAATQLAGGATQALKNMDPAIGDAVTGLAALGGSVMSGVSSPEAVQGIKELGKSLQDPANEQGIQNLTSGIMTLGTAAAQVLTDTAGAVGQMTGMGGDKAQSPLLAAALGAFMGKGGGPLGALASAGLGFTGAAGAEADQAAGVSPTDALLAEGAGAMLPGSLGLGGKAATALGMGAKGAGPMGALLSLGGGIGGQALERGAGAVGGGKAAGAVAGALSGAELGAMIGAPFGGFGGLIGAGIGGVAGGITGYLTSEDSQQTADNAAGAGISQSDWLAGKQTSSTGWDKDPNTGMMKPSSGATDPMGGNYQLSQPKSPVKTPGDPSSLDQMHKSSLDGLSSSTANLSQNTTTAMESQSKLGQQSVTTAGQVSQVPSAAKPATQALSTLPQQAETALGKANDSIAASSQAMGSTVPASFSTGVKANTGAACDATAQMSKSAGDCGAAALQSASPSKVFVTLGEGIGQGLAIGVQSGTPGAVSAVSRAMGSVVAAGAAGLGAQSPSKTFQAMGQNLMSGVGVAQGPGLQNPNQPGGPGTPPGAAANALAAAKNQTAIGAQLRSEAEKQNKDAEKAGSGALRSDPGGNAQQYSKTIMDRIAGHNENANLLKQERDQRHQDAKDASREGITPQQASAQRVQREQSQARTDRAAHDQAHPMMNPAGQWAQNMTQAQSHVHQQGQNLGQGMSQGMSQGLVVGMKHGQGAVNQGASDLGKGAIGAAKKKLNSDSPSMEFHDIGSDISAGLALGIGHNADSAHGAVGDMCGDAMDAARDRHEDAQRAGNYLYSGLLNGLTGGLTGGGSSGGGGGGGSTGGGGGGGGAGGAVGGSFVQDVGKGITNAAPVVSTSLMNTLDVASNYAKDASLVLGESMGTNIVSGLNTSITANLLKATGLAQGITSALAKTALGQQGLLGLAGSGAQSWNLTSTQGGAVSFGGGTPANPANASQPIQIHVHNYLDSQMLGPVVSQTVDAKFGELNAVLAGARR